MSVEGPWKRRKTERGDHVAGSKKGGNRWRGRKQHVYAAACDPEGKKRTAERNTPRQCNPKGQVSASGGGGGAVV